MTPGDVGIAAAFAAQNTRFASSLFSFGPAIPELPVYPYELTEMMRPPSPSQGVDGG